MNHRSIASARRALERGMSLVEVMIVVMSGSVGFIAFAILMPLIQMNDFGP